MPKLLASCLLYLGQSAAAALAVLIFFNWSIGMMGLAWPVTAMQADPWVGATFAAGSVVRWGLQGFGITHYVAAGEIATPFNEGPDIVVIGDSRTEAWQVDDDQKYVSLAEKLLWRRGRRVNLRNLGVGGLSMADDAYRAADIGSRHPRPSAVVLQLSDTSFEHSYDTSAANYFRPRDDGSLELIHRHDGPLILPWWRRVVLFFYADQRWKKLTRGHAQDAPAERPKPEQVARSASMQIQAFRERLGDIPVVILRAPDPPYVHAEGAPVSIALQAVRQTVPWPIVDPGERMAALRTQIHRDPATFFNDLPLADHYNRYGNAVLGEMLADEIEHTLFHSGPLQN
jgi:hypothetical protein